MPAARPRLLVKPGEGGGDTHHPPRVEGTPHPPWGGMGSGRSHQPDSGPHPRPPGGGMGSGFTDLQKQPAQARPQVEVPLVGRVLRMGRRGGGGGDARGEGGGEPRRPPILLNALHNGFGCG